MVTQSLTSRFQEVTATRNVMETQLLFVGEGTEIPVRNRSRKKSQLGVQKEFGLVPLVAGITFFEI